MLDTDTIAAVATPEGMGGIAIVRVSGPGAERVMRAAFRPMRGYAGGRPTSHKMYYGFAIDAAGRAMDEAMAVYFARPNSYTREHVIEIHCHGGRVAAGRVLRRVVELGARPAEPGEFTKRAFMNGRIDLTQAEAVMSMIAAGSEAAARASMRQLSGGASGFVRGLRAELQDLMSLIEASTDFPEEIDEPAVAHEVAQRAMDIADRLDRHSDERAAKVLREGVSVVLVGAPNVGKSSLMNALLRQDRAIVTDIPGTTRDVLTERMLLNGITVELSDTAGQRESQDPIESAGVERAQHAEREADVVVVVIDGSHGLTPQDDEIILRAGERCVLVVNKLDLGAPHISDGIDALLVSALTGEGIDGLLREIERRAGTADVADDQLIQMRHIERAHAAIGSLRLAASALKDGAPLDVAAIDLWDAIRALGEITGEDAAESVIDGIFQNFCVGK